MPLTLIEEREQNVWGAITALVILFVVGIILWISGGWWIADLKTQYSDPFVIIAVGYILLNILEVVLSLKNFYQSTRKIDLLNDQNE